MFTKSAILFLYLGCIVVLVAALTCLILAYRNRKDELSKALYKFVIGLFVICFYDMGIYYCNYVIGIFSSMEILRFGNCIIALTIYLWICVQENLMRKTSLKLLTSIVKKYILFYAAAWMILTLATSVEFFYTLKWLLMFSDIILIIGAMGISTAHIIHAGINNKKRSLYFLTIVTALLLWNYISYFWGETSVYWGNSDFIRQPLDLTIVFWIIIAFSTMLFVSKEIMAPVFFDKNAEQEKIIDAREKMRNRFSDVCEQYNLTNRERELIELIYAGKSNREIAELLFVSESTVKTHIYNIFRKMQIKSRVAIICIINDEQ